MDIKDLKEFQNNPRTLTKKQHDLLKHDLLELGDLSGIVNDLNSGQVIGGNQRVKIFRELPNPEIVITERLDKPSKTGTVAHGYVVLDGERYAYREVRWTEKQCQKANIVANKAGGEWDFNILANSFEIDDLSDWGFSENDLFELEGSEVEKLKEQEKNLEPYKKVHVLISIDIDKIQNIGNLLDQLREIEGVEIETKAN
jgi:hypothetical protein